MKPMGKNISLNNSEWKVMDCLWNKEPQTIMQLVRELQEAAGWNKSTTTTVVRRMEQKQCLRYENGDKSRLYYPMLKREDVALFEAESVLEKAFNGNIGVMVNALISRNKLSKEEILELKEILHKSGEYK